VNYPLVSIVICCHNRAELLPHTLESALNQYYRPVEIIVLDDGSTDGTQELMKNYSDKICYYRQKSSGVAAARTAACKLAKGEYIAFLDDDDLMSEDRICRLYEALRLYPSTVLAFGDWAEIDNEGNLTGEQSNFKISSNNVEPLLIKDGYRSILWSEAQPLPHTSMFRRVHGERIGWFDTRFHVCEDADFFARCSQLGPIVYVPKIVSYYRRGHESLSSADNLRFYGMLLLYSKHLRLMKDEQIDLKKRLQQNLFNTLKKIAILRRKDAKLPSSISNDYVAEGLSLIGLKYRLRYAWFILIKLQIRRISGRHPKLKKYGKELPIAAACKISEYLRSIKNRKFQ